VFVYKFINDAEEEVKIEGDKPITVLLIDKNQESVFIGNTGSIVTQWDIKTGQKQKE